MAVSTVPLELTYEILGHLHDDIRTLKTCALVSRAWSEMGRGYLFHSLDLPFVLAKNNYDWISLFLNIPARLRDYVRRVSIKDADWSERGAIITCAVKALRHFSPKATILDISDTAFPDFLDLVKILCAVKNLGSLSLHKVNWTTNSFEPTDIDACSLFIPQSLSALRVHYTDTSTLLGWIFAHPPTLIPKITALYFGPSYCHLDPQITRYICNYSESFVELGMLLNPRKGTEEYAFYYRSPTIQDHRCDGNSLKKIKNGVEGWPCLRLSSRLRILRFHDFLNSSAAQESSPGPMFSTVVVPRALASMTEKFCGTLIFDVQVHMVSQVDLSMVEWAALENVLSHEDYDNVKEIVFRTWTRISLVGLENLIARMMPRTYSRRILKFERETSIPFNEL